jgi:basic amino acid/polyamine antiporter, APA family
MPLEVTNRAERVGGAAPMPELSALDAAAVIFGIVVGVGIFKSPSVVAQNLESEAAFLLVWPLGGLVSLVGALCYAELATAYPHAGGDYHYFTRSFGREIALLFAWARLAITQTGSIAILAFVFGDYAAQLLPLGAYAPSVYAALSVALLTLLNAAGVRRGAWMQNLLTAAKLLGLLSISLVGLALAPPPAPAAPAGPNPGASSGLAMIFVLLTYGGWSEAAFLSAELRDVRRNMTRALLLGVAVITAVFVLVNLAYLRVLGLEAMGRSEVVAADLMRHAVGEGGSRFISLLIAVSALGANSGTIFTGARTSYALGQDVPAFRFIGRWDGRTGTPVNALLVQGAIALALVVFGTLTRHGFSTLVEYTAPVFWFFLLLGGLSLFVLRTREPEVPRPFRVPLYPFTPLLFCATCIYMLQASLTYTGVGALVSVAVLLTGGPVLLLARRA